MSFQRYFRPVILFTFAFTALVLSSCGGAGEKGISDRLVLGWKDALWVPGRNRLYVTNGFSGYLDSVVEVDPVSWRIVRTIQVGMDPGKLAASGDGKKLYVSLDVEGRVQAVDLDSWTLGSSFALGEGIPGPQVLMLFVMPGTQSTVVVSYWRSADWALRVFDDGVPRPEGFTDTLVSMGCFASSNEFLCIVENGDLARMAVGPTGLEVVSRTPLNGLLPGGEMWFESGHVLFNSGQVYDAMSGQLLGTCSGLIALNADFSPSTHRLFGYSSQSLLVFDSDTYQLLGEIPLEPEFTGTIHFRGPTAMGQHGVAVMGLTNQGNVVKKLTSIP